MFAFKNNHSANTELANYFLGTDQWLGCLVASVSMRWLGFNPKPVNVRSMVDKATMAKGFLQLLQFSPVSIPPPMLHRPVSSNYHRRYISLATDSPLKNPSLFHQSPVFYVKYRRVICCRNFKSIANFIQGNVLVFKNNISVNLQL